MELLIFTKKIPINFWGISSRGKKREKGWNFILKFFTTWDQPYMMIKKYNTVPNSGWTFIASASINYINLLNSPFFLKKKDSLVVFPEVLFLYFMIISTSFLSNRSMFEGNIIRKGTKCGTQNILTLSFHKGRNRLPRKNSVWSNSLQVYLFQTHFIRLKHYYYYYFL